MRRGTTAFEKGRGSLPTHPASPPRGGVLNVFCRKNEVKQGQPTGLPLYVRRSFLAHGMPNSRLFLDHQNTDSLGLGVHVCFVDPKLPQGVHAPTGKGPIGAMVQL